MNCKVLRVGREQEKMDISAALTEAVLVGAGGDSEVSGGCAGKEGPSVGVLCHPRGASGQRSLPQVPRPRRPHPQSLAPGEPPFSHLPDPLQGLEGLVDDYSSLNHPLSDAPGPLEWTGKFLALGY